MESSLQWINNCIHTDVCSFMKISNDEIECSKVANTTRIIKMLLLGPAGGGKSTVVKQMQLIHGVKLFK